MSFALIQTVELASSANVIEFTNIPGDAKDLVLLTSLRGSAYNDYFYYLKWNGITTSYYNSKIGVDGSTKTGGFAQGQVGIALQITGNNQPTGTFTTQRIDFYNYAASGVQKLVGIESAAIRNTTGSNKLFMHGGIQANLTDPITTITLDSDSAIDFMAGSVVSLYQLL